MSNTVSANSQRPTANSQKSYTAFFLTSASPRDAFSAIGNVTKWWTVNLEGNSKKLNDVFTVRFGDVHRSTQKLVEVIADKKIVWLVTDSNLNFISNRQEWTNTTISFEITQERNKTQVRFTHHGLVPDIECFDACSNAWSEYIQGSLKILIDTGKGQPTL